MRWPKICERALIVRAINPSSPQEALSMLRKTLRKTRIRRSRADICLASDRSCGSFILDSFYDKIRSLYLRSG